MEQRLAPRPGSCERLQKFVVTYRAVLLLFLVALATGCSRPMDRASLVFLNGAEPQSLDPAAITGQPDGRIATALFEGLTAYDEKGQPQPGVAERWEVSADGRVYTFHLRTDARWSNGEPVTSADFVKSWRRTLLPETASEYAYQLHYIRNARPFNEGKLQDFAEVGVQAPDPQTLVVSLENPTPFFLNLCAFATLLPVHVDSVTEWEKKGQSWTKPGRLISNGAYVLEEWRLFDRIRLRQNPHYWNRANVGMETVDAIPSARPHTAFNLYTTGEADLMLDKGLVPTSLMAELRHRPDFHSAPFLGNYFIRFNATRKPFDDVRVRQAISLAIDKQSIVDKITRGGELPADSLTPPGTAGYAPPAGPKMDIEQAQRLLAEAGFPKGQGFPLFYYLYKGDSDLDRDIAVELQGMLQRNLGVTLVLQPQEWKVYLSSMSTLNYDLCRSSWVGDYNDPNTFLDMFVKDGGNNRTGWADARYDELIAAAGREVDQANRYAHFQEAERLLISEAAPICPLYYYVGIQFYDAQRLGGIELNVTDEHPIRRMYWKKPR